MSGSPSRQCPAAMSRATTSRTWAAVTSVASSAGPSRTASSGSVHDVRPGLQRRDQRVRPARDHLRVPLPPRVAVAEQPLRAGLRVRPQPVAHIARPAGSARRPRPAAAAAASARRSRAIWTSPAVQRVVDAAVPAAALRLQATAPPACAPAPACTAPRRHLEQRVRGACRSTGTARRGTPPAPPRARSAPSPSWTSVPRQAIMKATATASISSSVGRTRRCRGGRLLSRRHAGQHRQTHDQPGQQRLNNKPKGRGWRR